MLKSREQLEREWMGRSFAERDAQATDRLVRSYREKTRRPPLDLGFVLARVLPAWAFVYAAVFLVGLVMNSGLDTLR